jgi:hypothetical protein
MNPAPSTTTKGDSYTPDPADLPAWFIFTDSGQGYMVHAERITQAVATWRKARHPSAGRVVAVIKGAAEARMIGQVVPSPCFGVIVCVQKPANGRGDTQTPAGVGSASCNGLQRGLQSNDREGRTA